MIIHVMIMICNTWTSVKEACLKHVFNTGTGSVYWYNIFSILVLVEMIPVLCFLV